MHAPRIEQILGSRQVHAIQLPSGKGNFCPIPESIPLLIREWLNNTGISELYSHQAETINHFSNGHDVLISTGTGSGKSLSYVLPALKACYEEPAARCLFLFPTKALAQDQLSKLQSFIPTHHLTCATYDGDTPKNQRAAIRRHANIVLSNPDMLHIGIMPGHENWVRFLKNLRLIVIDEAHVYRGAFGGHMGWIIRRLLRLCEWHGAKPQIIASSATISNSAEHFADLTGRKCVLVHQDGAPKGEKQIVVVEAPDDLENEIRSPNVEVAQLLAESTKNSVRTMVFCRSRNAVEVVLKYARNELIKVGGDPQWIDSYRGGYTPQERRKIESKLFGGMLRGVVTTNAMELGVDVGGLDLVIMNGYPGTRSSFWQQSGRAGRGGMDGMAIMVAHVDPLEQFLARRINLLAGEPEPSIASVRNPSIQIRQIRCAAYERPLSMGEISQFEIEPEVAELVLSGELTHSVGMYFYPSHKAPATDVNIRSADNKSVNLLVNGQSIGDMEHWRAMQYAHLGAIHLYRGDSFIVTEVNLDAGEAHLQPFNDEIYTQPIVQSLIEPVAKIESESQPDFEISLEAVTVTTLVTGFRRLSLRGSAVLSEEALEPTSKSVETIALRLSVNWGIIEGLELGDDRVSGAVHGVEHVLGALSPFIAGCDRRDIGTSWSIVAPDSLTPSVFIYDVSPGGLGLVEEVFKSRRQLFERAFEVVSECKCLDGCPLCLLSTLCECRNELLNKLNTKLLLGKIRASLGHLH